MAPIRVRGDDDDGEDDSINRYLRLLHRERARAERARQAYVALTRAKRSLHLFVHPRVKQTPDGAPNSAPTRIRCCTISGPPSADDAATFAVVGDERRRAKSRRQSRRRASDCRADCAAIQRSRGRARRAANCCPLRPSEDEIEFSWARQTARRVGTVVHEALERFGRAADCPRVDDLPRMRARLESRLQALGVEARAARDRRRSRADRTARDARGSHAAAGCSIPRIATRTRSWRSPACAAAHIVNAVIDRTFVDAGRHALGGRLQDQPARGRRSRGVPRFGGRALHGAAARATRTWRASWGREPVRAGLYFPLLAAWREVDVG